MESLINEFDEPSNQTLFYKTNKRTIDQLKSEREARYMNYASSKQSSRTPTRLNSGFKSMNNLNIRQPNFEGVMNRRKLIQLWNKFSDQPISEYLKVNERQEIGHTFKISRANLKFKFDCSAKTQYDRVFSESPKGTKFDNYCLNLIKQRMESQLLK